MAYDIFLSYRRSDQKVARALVSALEARGLKVWWDQMIEGGEDWRDAIVAGLEQSRALVILFSDECNDSRQLRKELAIADTLEKAVIPVLIEDTKPRGHFLYELAARNWVQAFPHAEKRAGDLAEKLAADLRAEPGGANASIIETGNLSTHERAEIVEARLRARRKRQKARDRMRDFLPFRWMDVIGIPVVATFGALQLGMDPPSRGGLLELLTVLGVIGLMFTGAYGAIIFPIRYYMRKRRFWRAVWMYFLSSLFLYAACAVGFWFYTQLPASESRPSELPAFLFFTGVAWLIFFVIAFLFYFILSVQRALRSFRRNVEAV